ncbi:MAG: Ldh family oxidoreductase [Xanthobacteraceae bacterium]|nr:Ldh family oxidoreductase [Xanthobacteraceae bacterium]
MPTLTLLQAEGLVVRTLTRNRTNVDNARSVARALVGAEADGLKGHGLSRVPMYAAQAKVRKVDGLALPLVTRPRPGLIAVDAGYGFAFPALEAAEDALRNAVKTQGVAAAAIKRSSHAGAASQPVERLAQQGLVALMFVNTPAAMAPWGGSKAVFGTNPIAFACPLPGRPPLVIDLSLSKVARGNVMAAKQRGERLPPGWALDEKGQPTSDPDAALRGTMLPMGDAKGIALALMVELLAAGLAGANYAAEASSYLDAEGAPSGTGQLLIAFDPSGFGNHALGRFGVLAVAIESQQGARLPGERRLALRAKAKVEGLTISDKLMEEIEAA